MAAAEGVPEALEGEDPLAELLAVIAAEEPELVVRELERIVRERAGIDEPAEGEPPTFRTEARIAYDAAAIYVGIRAYDPDRLVGDREDVGITCALIPTSHPGVEIGRRHMALNTVFQNGPNWGKDVFVPMDCVIGGVDYVGQGWKLLMNCLAAGRSISLPAPVVRLFMVISSASRPPSRIAIWSHR